MIVGSIWLSSLISWPLSDDCKKLWVQVVLSFISCSKFSYKKDWFTWKLIKHCVKIMRCDYNSRPPGTRPDKLWKTSHESQMRSNTTCTIDWNDVALTAKKKNIHAHIAYDVLAAGRCKKLGEHLERMQQRVALQEMIVAAVSAIIKHMQTRS